MTTENIKLYKDNDKINHRNIDTYKDNIKELADKIRNSDKLDADCFLLQNVVKHEEKIYTPNHSKCDFMTSKRESNKPTEKRLCRCMKYYDSNECKDCVFEQKMELMNFERYKITDYEVPMKYAMDEVGCIDIEIYDKKTGITYATEVKPEGSSETLVRMIAEILTYTIGKVSDMYKPAICFFANSKQEKDFCNREIYEDEDFKYLLSLVDVFYITYKLEDNIAQYTIHNNLEKPLWK